MTVVQAPAKLNLGLEVVGRRSDGYHELCSILATVSIADALEISPGDGLTVTGPHADGVPLDPAGNLASRALAEVEAIAGAPLGQAIALTKNIPTGAGMAGGSADAAAVLRAAAGLGVTMSPEHTLGVALALGADVPFQLVGGAALVTGIGEQISPLPALDLWLAVAHDGTAASTADVFAELRPDEWTTGEAVSGAAAALAGAEAAPAAAGAPADRALLTALPNALYAPATRRYPGLAAAADRLRGAGWQPRLTGSGAAFFHVCADEPEARSLAAAAVPLGFTTWACHTLPRH